MKTLELQRLSFSFCLSVSVTNNFLSNFSNHLVCVAQSHVPKMKLIYRKVEKESVHAKVMLTTKLIEKYIDK